jgi:hypothetical protein
VGGELTVSSNLTVTGNVLVSDDLTVTGNVLVSDDLTVTGNVSDLNIVSNVNMLHTSNTASIKLNSNVVTEFPRSKKLIKYPREAIPGNNAGVGSAYTYSASDGDYVIKASSEYDTRFHASNAFDNNMTTFAWLSGPGGTRYTSGSPETTGSVSSSTFAKFGAYGEWLELKIPTSIYLNYVVVYPKDTRTTSKITSAIVWGSNTGNDGAWQRLSTISGVADYTESNPLKISVDSHVSYNYYALQITSINPIPTQYAVVNELQFWGVPEYDPEAHGVDVVVKSVPNVPNTDWLEVYYDAKDLADGAVTSVSDLSPNTNTGTPSSITVSDGAFVFNGTSSLIESSTTITNSTGDIPHTFSLWVKPSVGDLDDTNNHYLVVYGTELNTGKWSGISISNKRFASVIHASIVRFGPEVRSGEWYHIVLNYKSGGIHNSERFDFFINGSQIDTTALSTSGSQAGSATLNLSSPAKLVLGGLFTGVERSSSTIANSRLFNRALTTDEIYQLYAYQKEYFGHGVLGMTLKAGRLGIGTTEPIAALDVRGGIAVQGIMTTFTSPYGVAYPVTTISPNIWAVAGDSTARIGGGAISYTSGISIKYLNSVPMWFWGGNDEFVDIRNIIAVGDNTWTIAIAIAKKPETGMVLCNQVNDDETNSMTNHRIVYTDGRFNGDEYPPSGGGWNLRNNGDIQIPNESVVVVKKEGNGTGQLFVYLNGHTIGSTTNNETGTGTAHKIRIGRRSRYSGYTVDGGGGIHGGIAAIAAWDSAISQTDMTKYITYQSMTSKN